ncbi:glycine cleavage system aminomethyltransferase GcvT [Microvirga arsenatis]|uniref:aminomethyltransferase n=1 Tax=Microvirga arsenatis TaxID=2692265 RepID=A0ABW9YZQ8_9HYPH|nr:glycine cleavage system aminomethyltransferase GcvT [Microvirga arsenatis]NBJ11300.1 glycine cleavage system aminomethyltransferase GcvT [Microvirga arsenatis]NBJ25573.1 glycine cleavage system aminomethyltransferase GcvT [Microvirga arsenatis]
MAEPVHSDEPLLTTPLHAEHVALGARMVPFAGYDMPVQYPTGILTEHNWTREHAGLFDVSHMGQAALGGPDHETTARALEALIPADIVNLKPGQQRYSQLLDENGGILDDLMVTRPTTDEEKGYIYLVVNASMKEADYAHIQARLPQGVTLVRGDDRALLALQGPSAEGVLARLGSGAVNLSFMMSGWFEIAGLRCHVSRSGYTGEDGFEISVKSDDAVALWRALLADPDVKPIGLGARDSLRLEAGLCLYGHDIDPTTSPIEAGLTWSIQKRRREEGGFPGAARIQRELKEGPARVRVGIRPEGRAPAREGTVITTPDGREVGIVTSGGFGPTVNGPVAMGYVARDVSSVGTDLHLIVRGKPLPAKVAAMPFAPHRYKR